MLISKLRNYSSDAPFLALMSKCNKSTLLPLVSLFGLPVKKSARKAAFIEDMAAAIVRCAKTWMPLLPQFELELLRQILDNPKGQGVAMYKSMGYFNLSIGDLCLVVAVCDDANPDRYTLFLSTEALRETLRESVAYSLAHKAETPHLLEWEQMGVGLLNYFGVLPESEFMDELKRRTGVAMSGVEDYVLCTTTKLNAQFSTLSINVKESDDEGTVRRYYISPLLGPGEVSDVFHEQDMRNELSVDLGKPSNEELMAYGTRPFMQPFNVHERKLHDFLHALKQSHLEVDWMYSEAWRLVQGCESLIDVVSWITQHAMLGQVSQLQELMNVFTEFGNNIPKWNLCGWTSREVFEKFEKPRMRPLPPTPFNPFVSPFSGNQTITRKVGRNDPCPCGSGKKYKHCCGRVG